ncbi:hypothetical protein AGDE_09915 [Angomonas deanei]|nr:hypothetical protein AGDE_09915 [Angomonas deanei]|eukprot:EPY29696.1 hypothetical protein AGDE_09915 [Angomonas deanei]
MKNRSGPRSGKFSEIKHLQERNAPDRHHEVRDTLNDFDREREQTELAEDADLRVNRNRYAQLVVRFKNNAAHYNSISLFVESMMREVNLSEGVSTRAAAATWALNLLATQPSQHALLEVIHALLPAVYCRFDSEKLPYPSAAIQLQVKDPDTIYWNPYFTHTMFVDQVDVDKGNVNQLADTLKKVLAANISRRDFISRFIENRRVEQKRNAFHAWRAHVRKAKSINFINESKNRRHEEETDTFRLQAVFYQWKVQVETSRSGFLTERLHESAAQLENAKIQYQLQCYRADRLIESTKEAKDELEKALTLNAGLEIQLRDLRAELVRKEKEYSEKLIRSVQSAFDMAQQYRTTLSSFHQMLPPPATYLGETPNFKEEIDEEVNLLLGYGEEQEAMSYSDTLFQWCNGVLYKQSTDKENFIPVRNFGSDFASGEVFYELMKFVFPALCPVLPPNCDRDFRINRLKEMSQKANLCYVLEVADFTKPVEDRIALAVSELFRRYAGNRWNESALKSFQLMEESEHREEETSASTMKVTEEADFIAYLSECQTYLHEIKTTLSPQVNLERQLSEINQRVQQGEAHLTAQRLQGVPVPHVGSWSLRHFWMINNKSLADLKEKIAPTMDAQLWSQLLQGPLKVTLRENAETTAKLFYSFAGRGGKTLSETSFWRFVDRCGLPTATYTKENISAAFDRVASPQLATLLKGQGKSEEETRTLLTAARQEMDIRQVSDAQFTEILVRIAGEYYGDSFGLTEGVEKLLNTLKSSKTSVHASLSAFWTTEPQEVFRFFGDDLARIFFFYVKKQKPPN